MPDPNTEHGLRVQLATALRERDEARALADTAVCVWCGFLGSRTDEAMLAHVKKCEKRPDGQLIAAVNEEEARADAAESERDALRTALQDIVTLCMDVPATEDWRAKVGDKARKALYGEPGWKQT